MNVLLCPLSEPGYLYPAIAVGLELRRRTESVCVLAGAPAAQLVAHAGLPLLPAEEYGGRGAFSVTSWGVAGGRQFQVIAAAARDVRPDVLVTSVLCNGALLAAEVLDLPVVVIGFATYLGQYRTSTQDEPPSNPRTWQSAGLRRYYGLAREQAALPDQNPGRADSALLGNAFLLRGDPALEQPGAVLPEQVRHVGPCEWEPAANPARLDRITAHLTRTGKPVIYVHLGRVFGGSSPWPRLNATFTGGPFQAVVELGRSADPQPAPSADILAVREPWMGPLIDRAGLVLTSGTSAPVLNALLRGRPLGVSPAGSEQPLLAQACVRAGVAVNVPNTVSHDPFELLWSAWHDRLLRAGADELGRRLAAADGSSQAADIITRTVTGHVPHLPDRSGTPTAGASSAPRRTHVRRRI